MHTVVLYLSREIKQFRVPTVVVLNAFVPVCGFFFCFYAGDTVQGLFWMFLQFFLCRRYGTRVYEIPNVPDYQA